MAKGYREPPRYIKYNTNLYGMTSVLGGLEVELEGPPGDAGGAEAAPARRGVV